MWFRAVTSACQPGSTTMVWCGSMISAAPATFAPGPRCSRRWTRRVVPGALGVEPCPLLRLGRPGVERCLRLVDIGAAADGLDFKGLDDDALAVEDEAELLAVRGLEGGDHRRTGQAARGRTRLRGCRGSSIGIGVSVPS